MTQTRYCFMADNDGHWYLIPYFRKGEFGALFDNGEGWTEEWQTRFEASGFHEMRIDMHISNYSFTDPQEL